MRRPGRCTRPAKYAGRLAAIGFIALSALPFLHPDFQVSGAPAAVTLTVDGARTYQRIDGLGVNVNPRSWNGGELGPALDMLADQMGAHVWRVILENADWETTNDDDDPFNFNWDYYNTVYGGRRFQDLWSTLTYLNGKDEQHIILNTMGIIPDWIGRDVITAATEDEWVEMIASMAYYARNVKHVQFDMLSPMNEEDAGAPEGPRVDSSQYVRLINKLIDRLSSLGLDDIRIVGPDTAEVRKGVRSYIPDMLASPTAMAKVDHLSLHSYSGDSGSAAAIIRNSAYPNRSLWITEWSEWCGGCDNGRPVTDEWSFATATTNRLFDHLSEGVSAALVYEAYDSFYQHHNSWSYWGQLAYNDATGSYTPRKRFYTNAQVFRFVVAGSERVGVSISDPSMRVLAFYHPSTGQVTIVGYNAGTSPVGFKGSLANIEAVSTLQLYQTTASVDLLRGPDVPVSDGSFSVDVEPDAFFTLTGGANGPGTASWLY